jgi:hypothetical protein
MTVGSKPVIGSTQSCHNGGVTASAPQMLPAMVSAQNLRSTRLVIMASLSQPGVAGIMA